MAPIAKENEVLTATTTETAGRPSAAANLPNEGTNKPQPVALEVAVSVNGARTVDGSDKREPFSESTKTVLVFGNGAVIRLQSPVAPGQLLFLTNDKTKKEVVCQVVKSKNYRNVSGYVELEFTETVVGFWGMRFPGDRIGGQSPAAGMSNGPIAAKPIVQPVAATAPPKAAAPMQPKTDAAANFNALKALTSSPATSDMPQTPDVNVAPPVVKVQPPTASSEVKPAASDASTEALKQQAARLQEELTSMLFVQKANASVPTPPPAATKEIHETAAKILEFVKPEPPQLAPPTAHETPQNAVFAPPKPAQPVANAPVKSLLDAEEVKIPSWLEPLARNAANASAAEEAARQEEWGHKEEPVFENYIAPEPEASSAGSDAQAATLPLEVSLPELELTAGGPSGRSNKGLLIGAIAAGLVLAAAGGAWFVRNQSGPAQASTALPVTTAAAVQTPTQTAGLTASGTPTNAAVNSPAAAPAAVSSTAYPAPNSSNTGAKPGNASVNNAVVKTTQPAPVQTTPPVPVQVLPQPKKPALGEVRLAAPTINRKGQAQSGNEAEPGISLGNSDSVPDASLGGLESRSKGPAAPVEPLAVGGDVRPAKLVTSVSPIYPSLAKSQHVAGDVKVDALIDANGKVTTMKVVSGPTLLHQAAMDALRQWKYQPATLDGKTVPMHLTVTLQFRLQ